MLQIVGESFWQIWGLFHQASRIVCKATLFIAQQCFDVSDSATFSTVSWPRVLVNEVRAVTAVLAKPVLRHRASPCAGAASCWKTFSSKSWQSPTGFGNKSIM